MTHQEITAAIHNARGFDIEVYRASDGDLNTSAMPNYCNDLNAMHEAERTLTSKQWNEYVVWLNNGFTTFSIEDVGGHVFTCSAQRAEAFLKTLNLWK